MKDKYKYRKDFEQLAKVMGLEDKVMLTTQYKRGTQDLKHELVNNGRRFMKSMMRLPIAEQRLRLEQLKLKIEEAAADRAAFEAKQAEAKDGNTDGQ